MVAINTSERDNPVQKATGFRDRHKLTYPILIDADGKVREAFAVNAFPTNVIIDAEGKVRYIEAGFNRTGIDQALGQLMGK